MEAKAELEELFVRFDYNCDIYQLQQGQAFHLILSKTLDDNMLNNYEYVQSGKIYRESYEKPNYLFAFFISACTICSSFFHLSIYTM